jgi:predicted PurR-regulated permease PerM
MQQPESDKKDQQYSFQQKVWIAGGIFAFIVVLLLLIKATFNVLLLVLAGVLIAVFFRGLSGFIQRKTKWKEGVSVTISVLATIILLALFIWLIGAKVQAQVAQLTETLPSTIENVKSKLIQSELGKQITQKISSPRTQKQAQSVIQTFFKSTFGVLGDIYVVLFIGIFFTVSPGMYKTGIIKLVPPNGKKQADEVLTKIGDNLKKWLKGKLFAMLVVFVLTSVGLIIIGIPMWLVLALIAGVLNFIPNFGPLIAMIPAVLVALLQGPATAVLVAGLYILIQVAESNFITPVVQKKLINLPPALIIMAQLFVAPLTGGWGLVLATPLMVILIVLVNELYVKKQKAHK